MVASPAALAFGALGAANAQTLNVAESAFAGTFGESDTCAGIVQVAPTANLPGPSTTVTVTALGPGNCTITVLGDQSSGASGVPVVVTTSGLVVSGRRARR